MKHLLVLTALMLAGCGTGAKTLSGNDRGKAMPKTCPGTYPNSFHEIVLHTSRPMPAKIAVLLEGERKVDECHDTDGTPPVVQPIRDANSLDLKVLHYGAYPELPTDVSFQVLDLGNCAVGETEFVSVSKLPLSFRKDYPAGVGCGARYTARVEVTKP